MPQGTHTKTLHQDKKPRSGWAHNAQPPLPRNKPGRKTTIQAHRVVENLHANDITLYLAWMRKGEIVNMLREGTKMDLSQYDEDTFWYILGTTIVNKMCTLATDGPLSMLPYPPPTRR
mmetsp:Transcript_44317/g.134998  ORF Transcript_44317/g.134998 Transcript_44317/m.134998 type:complete len:118 (-) Transcript_44317:2681-3034(-)